MRRSIVRMCFPHEVVCDFYKAVIGSIPPLTKLRQTLNLSFDHLSAKEQPNPPGRDSHTSVVVRRRVEIVYMCHAAGNLVVYSSCI